MSRLPFIVAVGVGVVACKTPADPGTSVGNPTMVAVRLAPAGDLEFTEVRADIAGIVLESCAGGLEEAPFDANMDLMHAPGVAIPAGNWCEMALLFASPVLVHAEGVNGGSLQMDLDVEESWVGHPQGLWIDDNTLVWELGGPGWTSAEMLGIEEGVDLQFGTETPESQGLSGVLVESAALWFDDDANGHLDELEREEEPLAAFDIGVFVEEGGDGGFTEEPTPGANCNVASSRLPGTLAWLMLVVAISARRRRTCTHVE